MTIPAGDQPAGIGREDAGELTSWSRWPAVTKPLAEMETDT